MMDARTDRQLQALFFDFGGVFTASPFTAVNELDRQFGTPPGKVGGILFGPYHEDTDHPWHCLERGEISLEQAREGILQLGRKQHGLEVDIFQLFQRMAGESRDNALRQELVERVRALKGKGYGTGIITNNIKEFSQGWRSLLPVEELFDWVVDSSEVGMRKPRPEIYQLALERSGLSSGSEALFVDDFLPNVETARELGMVGIHVPDGLDPLFEVLDPLLQS